MEITQTHPHTVRRIVGLNPVLFVGKIGIRGVGNTHNTCILKLVVYKATYVTFEKPYNSGTLFLGARDYLRQSDKSNSGRNNILLARIWPLDISTSDISESDINFCLYSCVKPSKCVCTSGLT